tara:strand:+ start:1242 stop:2024 length:783 start_codon:yes stop_codon:yes gene_type:complete
MKGIHRLPRPLGSTIMARTYNREGNPTTKLKHKNTIINHTIRQYILQGHTLNGKALNMYQLGDWLGLTVKKLFKVMAKQTQELSGITGNADSIRDMLTLMGTLTIQNTLQTRAKVNTQTELLTEAQGDGYKPFISAEVNKALQLAVNSDKSMADLLKAFMGPSTLVNINQTHVEGDQIEGDKVEYLTINRAVSLVTDGHDPFEASSIKALEAEHITDMVPEVRAVNQEGVDDGSLITLEASNKDSESRSERRGSQKLAQE